MELRIWDNDAWGGLGWGCRHDINPETDLHCGPGYVAVRLEQPLFLFERRLGCSFTLTWGDVEFSCVLWNVVEDLRWRNSGARKIPYSVRLVFAQETDNMYNRYRRGFDDDPSLTVMLKSLSSYKLASDEDRPFRKWESLGLAQRRLWAGDQVRFGVRHIVSGMRGSLPLYQLDDEYDYSDPFYEVYRTHNGRLHGVVSVCIRCTNLVERGDLDSPYCQPCVKFLDLTPVAGG